MRATWLFLMGFLGACHHESQASPERQGPSWADRPSIARIPEFQAVASGARLADSVVFYEGLPRSMRELEVEKEKATKPIISLHDDSFYEQPLVMQAQDLEPLRAACADADNFRMTNGTKACDGFHPDYALSWQQGDRRFDFLFCFGCEEAKLYLGDTEALHVDMRASVFKPLLTKYRAQRPEPAPAAR